MRLGSRWRDSNGHEFVLERLTPDFVRDGEQYHAMHGPTTGCSEEICGEFWHKVHTNADGEFEEYHAAPRAWGTEREIRSGHVFGWDRVDA